MPRGKRGGSTARDQPLPPQQPAGQRKPREQAPRGESVTAYTQPAAEPSTYAQSIATAQRNSLNLVPVRTIIDLANLNTNQRDIAIAARHMARTWDVSPQVFFGERDPRKVVSQITGQPVSMAEAQRFTNYYSPVAIASMLGAYVKAPGPTTPAEGRALRQGITTPLPDAKRVSSFANALSRHATLPLSLGVAMAAHIATAEKFSPRTFEANLPMVRDWLEATTNGPVSQQAVITAAVALSRKGVVRNVVDIPVMLYGATAVAKSQQVQQNIAAGITYGTPEQRQAAAAAELTSVQQIAAAGGAQPGVAGAEGEVIPGEISPEGMLGPDYWAQANDIAAQVALDQKAFQNSFVGRNVARAFGFMNNVYHGTEKTIWDVALGAGTVLRSGVGGAFSGHPDLSGAYQTLVAAHQESWRRIEAGQNIGTFTRDGWSEITGYQLPDWTGSAIDFLVLWELDPFSVGGKATRLAREERLLPELERAGILRNALGNALLGEENLKLLEEGGNLGETGVRGIVARSLQKSLEAQNARYVRYSQETFPASSTSRRLFDAAATSNSKYLRELDFVKEGAVANRTLDYPFMSLLREKLLARYGDGVTIAAASRADAYAAWQDALRAHSMGWGPEGSVAREVSVARDQMAQGTFAKANQVLADDPAVLQLDLSDTLANVMPEVGWHVPYSQELPSGSLFSQLGPRTLTRRLMTGERFTSTPLGRAVAALPNMNPGREMPLYGPGASEHVLADARRTRVFSEGEARGYQQQVLDAQISGMQTETKIEDIRKQMEYDFTKRVLKPYGATEQDIATTYGELFGPSQDANLARQDATGFLALGPTQEEMLFGQPQMATQLRNSVFVTDPVEVRNAIRRYLGDFQMMKAHLRSALDLGPVEFAKNEHVLHAIASSSATWTQDVLRDFRHLWKALVVARPGYIPRVVLGDENARFLSVSNSIAERIMSQEIFAGLGDRLGVFDRVWRDASGAEFARVKLPGSFERNPLAVNDVRGAELREDIMRGATRFDREAQAAPLTWGNVIHATKASATGAVGEVVNIDQQMQAWTWGLSKQIAQDGAGSVALRSVIAGDDVAGTQAKLLRWAEEDHYVTLRGRIGIDPAHTEDWANQLASGVHIYTMDNPAIADVALHADAQDLRKILDNVPPENRPPVHGASLDALTAGQGISGKYDRALNFMYKWMVRRPEAAWNRHPFFKMMKRRATIGYNNMLERAALADPSILEAGGVMPAAIRQSIDHASTQFALDQVERVMFDFTKQSRFTELLQFFFPFPQPFFEGFQAWAHIIRRNPATIARAQALYRLGKANNFIRTDPVSGNEVVDMNFLKFPTRLLDAVLPGEGTHSEELFNRLGVNLVAPMTGFNLLAQSSVKLPTNWPLVQGMPSPFPGLRPELATLAQWAFRNTTNETLTSMLFQFGPHTNFIPRQVASVLDLLSPEQFKFKEENSLVLSILRSYQTTHTYFDAEGNPAINPDTKTPYTRDQIIAHAEADAQHLARLRNWLSLVSPASLTAQTAATPNEGLFQDYVNDAPNFSTALDNWHKDHPDLWLTPIGKTLYEGYIENPITQEKFRGPRLPSSEFVMRLLNTPHIGDLMKNDKAWAGLLLLGLPSDVTETQDWPTYSRLLASGDFRYRTPQEFWDAGESGIVQQKLSEIYQHYDSRVQMLTEKHVSSQDPAYGAAKDYLQTQFQQLARDHPTWVQGNLEYNDGQYSWPQGRGRPIEKVVAQATQITQTPGFEAFPGVQALGDYLDLRDRIKTKMQAQGYTDIMQGGGADALMRSYAKGVQRLTDSTPGFGPYLSALFGVYVDDGTLVNTDDLRVLQSSRSAAWEALRKKNPALYTAATNYDVGLNSRSPYYKQYDTDWQRSQDYYRVQQYADKMYADHPKVVKAWWATIGKPAQRDYMNNLAYKPAQYYNRFEWHLAGVELSDAGAKSMQGLAQWWVQYGRAKNADPNLDSAQAFHDLNAAVRSYAQGPGKKNGFDAAVSKINDWAFPLKAAGLADQPGRLGKAWGAVIDSITATQTQVVRDQITGVSGNAKNLNTWYSDTQTRFISYVKDQWFSHDPAFKKQWYEVQQAAGGDSLVGSMILPDTYYGPLGWIDYGKGV